MLLLVSFALAGEIQVQASAPVVVRIDGTPLDFDGGMVANAVGLAGGVHEVRVETLDGEVITEKKVDVPVDHQVRLKYANKALRITGEGKLPNAPEPALEVGMNPTGLTVNIAFDETEGRPPPVEPVPPPLGPPEAMGPGELTKLIAALQEESFSSDQLDLVRSAATRNHFTCTQVVQILEPFSFSSDKLEAVRILRPRVVDPEHAYVLNDAFDFSSDKEEVQALFR